MECWPHTLAGPSPAWDAFAAGVAARFGDASLEWRYDNDGNAWLGKVVRKKKTVCWVSVWDRFFKDDLLLHRQERQGASSRFRSRRT